MRVLCVWLSGLCGLYGMAAPAAASPMPDAESAVDAWVSVRAHIDDASSASWPEDRPFAVHLILRHDGRPLASSSGMALPDGQHPVQSAAEELRKKALDDSTIRGLPEALQAEGLRSTTLELEYSGQPEPLRGATLEQLAASLDPARDGIALRTPDGWHLRFPSQMRMVGSAATPKALQQLAMVAGLKLDKLESLRRTGAIGVYRFETIDLLQHHADSMPSPYERGQPNRIWSGGRDAIVQLTERVGRHLINRTWSHQTDTHEQIRLGGTYHPARDRSRPIEASQRDQALAALALRRLSSIDQLPRSLRNEAAEISDALTNDPQGDGVVAALNLMQPVEDSGINHALASTLLGDTNAPLIDRAIAAAALRDDPDAAPHIESLLNSMAGKPPSAWIDVMPWLTWADQHRTSEVAWSETLDLLSEQLRAVSHHPCCPSAVLRPAAAIPMIAEASDPTHAAALALTDRLSLTEAASVTFLHPERAKGGVTASPWDERMTIWAQAMAIFLLHDTLQKEQEIRPEP